MTAGMGQALPIDHERDDMTRFPMNRGIAGSVATAGVTINVPDAYQHPGFSKAMDKETGFRTKSILCMPIRNHKGDIIGVTQVINKLGRQQYDEESKGKKTKVALIRPFGASDEQMLNAFNAQAAVAIENSRLFTVSGIGLKWCGYVLLC
jgi:adenylate cyclase